MTAHSPKAYPLLCLALLASLVTAWVGIIGRVA